VIDGRVGAVDWQAVQGELDARGMACCRSLLTQLADAAGVWLDRRSLR